MISKFESSIEERKVSRTYLTNSGKNRNIYEVAPLSFDPKKLGEGYKYRIAFFAEMNHQVVDAVYHGATDDYRTLIVSNPYNTGAVTLGIPSYNIFSISPVV